MSERIKNRVSVVLGTFNNLQMLKLVLSNLKINSEEIHKVYICDAGSTDGTVAFLRSIDDDLFCPIFQGKRMGQARAYNSVAKQIQSEYICWLSDDDLVVNNGIGIAARILSRNPRIGMVGLKKRDIVGPFSRFPFIGGVTAAGIININQGVIRTKLWKQLGGFDVKFKDYGIDQDLTTKVLLSGFQTVLTKRVSIFHLRRWVLDSEGNIESNFRGRLDKSKMLYDSKYKTLLSVRKKGQKRTLVSILSKVLKQTRISFLIYSHPVRVLSLSNQAEYVNRFDTIINIFRPYHLRQKIVKNIYEN
jgi:GT2 family glycosyltransferase